MYSNYLNVYFFCLSIPVFHLSLFRFNLYLSIPISLSSDSSDSKRTLARWTSRWGWRWEEERDHWRCRWWWIRASQCGRRGGSLLRGSADGQVSASRRGQWSGSLVGGGGWPQRLWDFFVCCCWIVYKSLDLCCCWWFWECFQICVVVVVFNALFFF